MGKSKSHSLARLPKDQRCQFLIGPMSSWFMPDTSDLWTRAQQSTPQLLDNLATYFVYGSVGCFCYGTIHRAAQTNSSQQTSASSISAIVRHLVDIKEDNSRVSCVRFLKPASYPIIMALTESGSFIIYDCVKDETSVHMRKSELISKFTAGPSPIIQPSAQDSGASGEPNIKKARFNIMQQINSCSWPTATNAFVSISLLKEKTNLLIWLKLKDLTVAQNDSQQITKSDFIQSYVNLDLDLPQYSNPVCCMESCMLDQKSCLVALAMDDGLIKVVLINLEEDKPKRVITLARHIDQISSMSFHLGDREKFPLGLLASVSRNGLTFLWDIERGYYFADYLAGGGGADIPINWFSLSFISDKETNTTHLAVSNPDSGLTLLEVPKVSSVKKRLKQPAKERHQKGVPPALRHQALIFNVIFDPISQITMTSSLDGNLILWLTDQKSTASASTQLQMKPHYLIPSLPNNSRVHMMRHSPIQENLLGLCLGKAGVRFYKITKNLTQSRFDMNPGASLIARKINKASLCPTSLSWHPRNEYRVAIGTIEGKVLRVDLTPNRASLVEAEYRKPAQARADAKWSEPMAIDRDVRAQEEDDLFGVDYQPISRDDTNGGADCSGDKRPKTDGVYSICWGPNPTCPDDENRLAIYAVGSITHRLYIYYTNQKDTNDSNSRMSNYLDEFLDESLPEAIGEASEVAWKSSFDLMALGTTHGKVIIVEYLEESHADRSRSRLFRKLAVIKDPMGSAYIQCLVWHPTLDEEDARYHYIACSSNESPVFVFDVRRADTLAADVRTKLKIEDDGSTHMASNGGANGPPIISEFLYKLDAHKKPVSDVAWNPHQANQLATCSFDRFCYVWSLDEEGSNSIGSCNARLCSKYGARDRLFTLEWSLVDSDLVYTSGHDSIVWAWRPSENLTQQQ